MATVAGYASLPVVVASSHLHSPAFSLTIGELARLPIDDRFDAVWRSGRSDCERAVRDLDALGADLSTAMSAEQVAWAMALNVSREPATELESGARNDRVRRRRTLLEEFGEHVRWPEVWAIFVGPDATDDDIPGDAPLRRLTEFALSVACEQRPDWRWPAGRPLVHAEAERAQAFAFQRYDSQLRRALHVRFGDQADGVSELTQEVWVRVFEGYWGEDAWKRFLGVQGLLGFLTRIGRNVGIDLLRRQRPTVCLGGEVEAHVNRLGVTDQHPEHLYHQQVRERIHACLANSDLSVRDRLICQAVWFKGAPQVRVARAFSVEPPRVHQVLARALKKVRVCLGDQEFSPR